MENSFLYKRLFFLLLVFIFLSVVLAGTSIYFAHSYGQCRIAFDEKKDNCSSNSLPTPSPVSSFFPVYTSSPSPVLTSKPLSTLTPTPTPVKRSFDEEEKLMRKTLAGFEMYIGTRNTAGALTFFTPPKTDLGKQKLAEIKTKNLPYGLNAWEFVEDSNYKLVAEEINNGYRVRMKEYRTNNNESGNFTIVGIELVRDSKAENGFSIDRYYTSQYFYQNNLGEEIKYQGFQF
jgi:hypothetical protein